jgi:hypothetical protein
VNALKVQVRTALTLAREARKTGATRSAATHLDYAGELRRSAFYLYR